MVSKNTNSRRRSKIKIRKRISGTPESPRLTVYRSIKFIYAQLIDDLSGVTMAAASSLSPEIKEEVKNTKGKVNQSKLVGKYLAQKALEKNISTVVFDRNGFRYHGRIKAIADGAREGGLKF